MGIATIYRKPLAMSNDLLTYLPKKFVVLDFETTGLNPDSDLIIETAGICYSIGELNHAGHNCLVKIDKPVPQFINKLTGISSEMLESDGYEIDLVLDALIAFIADYRVVTFNAQFDLAFLNAALDRAGKSRMKNPFSCALQMARRAWPNLKSYKLTYLAECGGVKTSGAHRALKDCELAIHVYLAAANKLQACE